MTTGVSSCDANDYRTECNDYRWEPVELLRKLTLTGFLLLIPEEYDLSRALAALLLSLLFFAAQGALKPFKRATSPV